MTASDIPLEQVAEVFEEMGEASIQAAEAVRGFNSQHIMTLVAGIAIGGGVSYFVTKKLISAKIQEAADDEISEMAEHYRKSKFATDEKPSPADLVEDLGYVQPEADIPTVKADVPIVEGETSDPEGFVAYHQMAKEAAVKAEVEAPAEPEVENIFDKAVDIDQYPGWDWDVELEGRGAAPFVIHRSEWFANEPDHEQVSYLWFDGDEVLCDNSMESTPLDDPEALIGLANLKFNHGSGDEHTVYVRNIALGIDAEITRSNGKYSHEVHGLIEPEPERNHRRKERFDD